MQEEAVTKLDAAKRAFFAHVDCLTCITLAKDSTMR